MLSWRTDEESDVARAAKKSAAKKSGAKAPVAEKKATAKAAKPAKKALQKAAPRKPAAAKAAVNKKAAPSKSRTARPATAKPARNAQTTKKKIVTSKKAATTAAPEKTAPAQKSTPSKAAPAQAKIAATKAKATVKTAPKAVGKAAPETTKKKADPKSGAAGIAGNSTPEAPPKQKNDTTIAAVASATAVPSTRSTAATPTPAVRTRMINLDEVKLPAGYVPTPNEEYMSPVQLLYFRTKLMQWRDELIAESQETLDHLRSEIRDVGDEAERASRESDNILELRTRDRYRKLLNKISDAMKRIEDGSYGFCEETGEEIGLGRLEARPIATLTVDAQERREMLQRQFRDDR